MKFLKRLFRLFSIKGNKTLKKFEDGIEVYEHELMKSKENIDRIQDSMSKLRADKRIAEEKKRKSEGYIQELKSVLKQAVIQNDDDLGEETMSVIEANERKLEMFQANIDSYTSVIEQLEHQHASLKERYREKASKLEGLRAKSEFVKNMETVNKELKEHYSDEEFDFTSFEKIEEELKSKVYYEQDRNLNLTPEPSIQERAAKQGRKSRFQEFKQSVQEESKPVLIESQPTFERIIHKENV